MKEIIYKKLPEYLLAALIGTLSYLLAIVWKEIFLPVAQKLLPELSKTGLLAIILIQFLLLIIGCLYILLSRSKRRKYRFDKRLGIYFHKKTNDPFCTSCLAMDIESPLLEVSHGWTCKLKSCEQFYNNPDYQKPPESPRPKGTWMSR